MGYGVPISWHDQERVNLQKLVSMSKQARYQLVQLNNWTAANYPQNLSGFSAAQPAASVPFRYDWTYFNIQGASSLDTSSTAPGGAVQLLPATGGTFPYLQLIMNQGGGQLNQEEPGWIPPLGTNFAIALRMRVTTLTNINTSGVTNRLRFDCWNKESFGNSGIYTGFTFDAGSSKARWFFNANGVAVQYLSTTVADTNWHTFRVGAIGTTLYGSMDAGAVISSGTLTLTHFPLIPMFEAIGTTTVVVPLELQSVLVGWDGP